MWEGRGPKRPKWDHVIYGSFLILLWRHFPLCVNFSIFSLFLNTVLTLIYNKFISLKVERSTTSYSMTSVNILVNLQIFKHFIYIIEFGFGNIDKLADSRPVCERTTP